MRQTDDPGAKAPDCPYYGWITCAKGAKELSLELRPEVESLVRRRARAEGISVDDLLSRVFAEFRRTSDGNSLDRVRALLAQWQAEDTEQQRITMPHPLEQTPAKRLFKFWKDQDAKMSDSDRGAEDDLWSDIESSLKRATFSIRNEPAA
jgi:hypothetical protein